MRRALSLGVAVVYVYAIVWGPTWLLGDRSFGVWGTTGGVPFSSYPGVFLGGLPPSPGFDSGLPEVLAMGIGTIGLIAVAARIVRARQHR